MQNGCVTLQLSDSLQGPLVSYFRDLAKQHQMWISLVGMTLLVPKKAEFSLKPREISIFCECLRTQRILSRIFGYKVGFDLYSL
mgnify:CR=1 FL=1